jgi:hypothetical protein
VSGDRAVKTAPCLKIEAADWLDTNDVRYWKASYPVASWGAVNGDVFTVYDHGEGPDKGEMPDWLWNYIEKHAKEAGLEYCIVWLEDC